MNVIHYILCIVTVFAYNPIAIANEVMVMFLRQYPTTHKNAQPTDHAHELVHELRQPGTIDHHLVHGILHKNNTVSGVFATYMGYLRISDLNGQITFPRLHEEPFNVIVTTKITPIIMDENTINHWELNEDAPAKMYEIKKEYDDHSGLHFWQTERVDLPKDKVVPFQAIILFAQPNLVLLPEGATVCYDRPNVVLPDIFIKKGIKLDSLTFYILNIKQFFGNGQMLYKKFDKGYSSLLVPHPGY